MNAQLRSLFDKKGKIVNEMKDAYRLVSEREGGIATTEEKAKFNAWDKELETIQSDIDFHQKAAKLELHEQAEKGVKQESGQHKGKEFKNDATKSERRNANAKALKVGYSGLNDEERAIVNTELRDSEIYSNWMRHGVEGLNEEERKILYTYKEKQAQGRAQSVGTTTAGGYTVPEGFSGRIIEKMKYISGLLNWANILNTDSGNIIPHPINDDTSNTGELLGENADGSSSSADLVFSVYNLSAYKFSSKMIKVSSELLQDNGVNLEAYLAKKLAERVARIGNTYFTTGTGSSQPQGCVTGSSRGKVTASTSTFTQAEMVAFQDSIDPAYANNPKVAWAMHQNLLSEIKQLSIAATADHAIWVPSFRDGDPDRILGKPYFLNQAMSSTSATGDKIFMYGDWDAFTIRVVNDFVLKRFTERYAEYDQVAFMGLARMDSFVEDSSALKYMDIS